MTKIKTKFPITKLRGKVRKDSNVSFRYNSETGSQHTYTYNPTVKPELKGKQKEAHVAFQTAIHYKENLSAEQIAEYKEAFVKQRQYKRLHNYIIACEAKRLYRMRN